jgi:hypothetical protein
MACHSQSRRVPEGEGPSIRFVIMAKAPDAVIPAGDKHFGDLPAPVQVRNQAPARLWHEQKSSVLCPPHDSTGRSPGLRQPIGRSARP